MMVGIAPQPEHMQLERKLVDLAFERTGFSIPSALLLASLIVAALWPVIEHGRLLAWLAAMAVIKALHFLYVRRYKRLGRGVDAAPGKWRTGLVVGGAAAGLCWGSTVFCFPSTPFNPLTVFGVFVLPSTPFDPVTVLLIFILAGVTAYASIAMAFVPAAAVVFLACAWLPLATWLISFGEHMYVVMGLIALSFMGVMVMLSRRMYASVFSLISVSEENRGLRTVQQESDSRMARYLDNAPGYFFTLVQRPDGSYAMPFASQGIQDIFGIEPADVEHDIAALTAVSHPDDVEMIFRTVDESASSLTSFHVEYRILHPRKGERWMECSSMPQREADGSTVWHGFVHDITGRKHLEEKLVASEREYRNLAENHPDVIIRYDLECNRTYVNPALAALAGCDAEKLNGRCPKDYTPLVDPDEYMNELRKVLGSGVASTLEVRVRRTNGESAWYWANFVPELDGNGNVAGVLMVAGDITERKRMDEVLHRSEVEFRTLAENLPVAVIRYDAGQRRSYLNPAAEGMLHGVTEELLGRVPGDGGVPATAGMIEHYRSKMAEVLASDAPCSLEFVLDALPADQQEYFEVRFVPEHGADGKPAGVLAIWFDITERKRMEETIAARGQEFRSLAESSPEYIVRYDREGRHRYLNGPLVRLLGLSSMDEVLGKRPGEIWLDGRFCAIEEAAVRAIASGEMQVIELFAPNEIGELNYNQIYVVPERDIHGDIVGTIAFGRDITEIKRLAAVLQKSHDALQEAQRIAHVGSWDVDMVNDRLTWSDEIFRIWEIDKTQFKADFAAFLETVHPEDRERVNRVYHESVVNHTLYEVEHRLLFPDGRVKHILERGEPQYDAQGRPVRFIGTSLDITERKRMEDKLAARERDFRSLAENLPDNIARWDTEGRYLYINPTHERTLGVKADEVVGKSISDSHEQVKAAIAQAVATGMSVIVEQRAPVNGDIEIHSVSLVPELDKDGRVVSVLGLGRNMTDIYRMQDAIAAREQEFRSLAESSPDPIYRYDRNCRRLYANRAVERLTGMSRDELLGKSPLELVPNPAVDAVRAQQCIQAVLDSGKPSELELSFIAAHGQQVTIHNVFVPEFAEDGSVQSVLCIGRDITERKKNEAALKKNFERIVELNEYLEENSRILEEQTVELEASQEQLKEALEFSVGVINAIPDTLFEMDREGRYHGIWTQQPELLAAQKAQLLNKTVHEVLPPETAAATMAAIREADEKGFAYGKVISVAQPDGEVRWFEHSISRKQGVSPSDTRFFALSRDVTERHRIEDVLRFVAEGEWMRGGETFLNALVRYLGKLLGVDYVVIDKIAADPAYAETVALYAKGDVVPNMQYSLQHTPCGEVLSGSLCCYHENVQGQFPRAGLLRDMQAESYVGLPLWDTEGRVIGLIAALDGEPMADTNPVNSILKMVAGSVAAELKRNQMENVLRESYESLSEAQRISHVGNWELDLASGALHWSDEIYRIFEIDPELFGASYEAFLDAIHPDDREAVNRAYTESLAKREPYEIEHRLLFADGRIKYVHERSETHYGEDGKPVRSLGTVQDITARKQAEQDHEETRNRLQGVLKTIPDLVWLKNADGVYLSCNHAFERFFGASEAEITGKMDHDFVDAGLADFFRRKDSEAVAAGRICINEEWVPFADEGGRMVLLETRKVPMYERDGRLMGVLGIGRDITESKQAEERMQQAHEFSQSVINTIPDPVFVKDREHRWVLFNDAFCKMLGRSREELLGKSDFDFIPEEIARGYWEVDELVFSTGNEDVREETLVNADGARSALLTKKTRYIDKAGQMFVVVTIVDITLRKQMEDELAVREQELRTLVDNTPDTISRYDRECRRLYVNAAFAAKVKGGAPALLGKKPSEHPAMENAALYEAKIREVFTSGEDGEFELEWPGDDGNEFCSLVRLTAERDAAGEVVTVLAVGRDITELSTYRQKIHQMAFYDSLTSLPNRALFNDRLRQMLVEASWHTQLAGVMMLDLDRFKAVNDTLGHTAGDELLRETAARLMSCVRSYDTVARLGGDEFAILLPEVRSGEDLGCIAGKILQSFAVPFLLGGQEVFVSTSIGIVLYPDDGMEAEDLIKHADSAMYYAKRSGRNNFRFYSRELTDSANERLMLEADLRRGFGRGELELHFQPKVRLTDGVPIGSEALLRWKHPQRGMVPPDKFISIAEDSGLIVEIGEWVLRTACRTACDWNMPGRPLHKVAINLSARQFQTFGLARTVRNVLEETGCYPEWIELEITESLLLDEDGEVLETLEEFRAMGISIAIDDFGTGYSALSYLARFPIDTLKIDRSFISRLTEYGHHAELVKAIVAIAHSLNQQVVAEGVETAEQAALLQAYGCQLAQGYFYGKPMTKESFEEYAVTAIGYRR
jgi:diguanylate cyclase (GGDEF)-like protein/PAS domain S-box-containing protein